MPLDPLSPVRLSTAYFILFCIALHVLTGINLVFFPESAGSTTVTTPVEIFGDSGAAGFGCFFVAICATLALRMPYPYNVLALLPQQAMLLAASIGIVIAVWNGHFADGVIRPRSFIYQDHLELPLICAFHAGVLMMRAALTSRFGPGLFFHPLEKTSL